MIDLSAKLHIFHDYFVPLSKVSICDKRFINKFIISTCMTMTEYLQLNEKSITLYGAGGHCRVVIDLLECQGERVSLIVDDNPKSPTFMSIPCSPPKESYNRIIVTIGDCLTRKRIVEKISAKRYANAIHPSAFISPRSRMGKGTVIMPGAVVQSSASIGNHCILNTHSSVEHDVIIHDFVHVASGAVICGAAEIGECTLIGAGSVVRQGIHVGKNCLIGAGSVVVTDIPDNVVAYGNPCRVIRHI